MYLLQDCYAAILNPIWKITGRISERVRNAVITVCCVLLSGFFILYYDKFFRDILYMKHGQNNMICGGILLILILFSVKGELKRVRWNPLVSWSMFLAGAGLVIVRMMHTIGDGYTSFGVMLMLLFPCLYFVWNNRGDYNVLYERLAAATCVTGLIFYIYCVQLCLSGNMAGTTSRVSGSFYNANLFSMTGMVMACAALYMFMRKPLRRIWFLLAAVSFGIGLKIVLLGVSRLSIMTVAGGAFSLAVFLIKSRKTVRSTLGYKKTAARLLLVLLITGLAHIGTEALLDINDRVMFERDGEILAEENDIESIEDMGDRTSAADRFNVKDKNLNSFTAGRIEIWNGYASQLNMWGNDFDNIDITEVTGCAVQHAHNNFFEIAFRAGIPVACLHILLELFAGIICLIFLFGKKYKDPAYLFAVIFMICYTVESMFDIATVPFERQAPFYFYMGLIPVFAVMPAERPKDEWLRTRKIWYSICRFFAPLKENKVLFLSDIRGEIGGNYAPLLDLLKERGFDVVCDFSEDKKNTGGRGRQLRRARDLATAGYIVLEDFHSDTEWLRLRKGQELVQLWHAAGAFKRFAWSRNEVRDGYAISSGYEKITRAIVSAESIRGDYAEAYKIDEDKVIATGLPRTDVFYDPEYISGVRARYDEKYPELKDRKIILFAPTYRGNNLRKASYKLDMFDPGRVLEAAGEDFALIIKWHPAMAQVLRRKNKKAYDYEQYGGRVLDLSDERDANDIMMIADVLITDYSSVIFEYELLGRPVIYYWYDIEKYDKDRGFFYDLDEYVYGRVAHDPDELFEAVREPDMCEDRRGAFHEKFMSACDGRSSERVIDEIFCRGTDK